VTDYSIKVTIRNGRILSRMRELGIPSIPELAKVAGVNYNDAVRLIAMKIKPYKEKKGDYTDLVYNVAAALKCDPDDLFTDAQRTMSLKHNSSEMFVEEETVAMLAAPSAERSVWLKRELEHLMHNLSPRERAVMSGRLANRELSDIGEELGIGRERVRQYEVKATRKMKAMLYSSDSDLARQLQYDN